jgi:hypothetical protein
VQLTGLRCASVLLGLLALFGENLFSAAVWEGILAAFMASIVVLWGVTMAQQAGLLGHGDTGAPTAATPV